MRKSLSFYFCLIITAFSVFCVHASDGPPLVGSSYATSDEVTSATDVVIAKFTKVWGGRTVSMTGTVYHGHIAISETLKGNESGDLEVGFLLSPLIRDTKESKPNLNDTYIVILADHHEIRKLLPATNDNITKIKALIAAAPAGK